ncbi:putative metalloendopeptidase; cell wall-binding protein associated metalloendopeptidase [Desulforapulum autotrophicum HRM2]|uniref:Metalloendopeptidase cell wall-binding protein associated metalloendopeptidase n=1 Tax=Desulforapulum autotrophicum (strain ATCC 43914 / DSM 3382 / VKM B-1955 / HRM2) TaxID=177437 RepID=C0QI22_DESAH|nr:M23 family metallopeptidase [Desulforapulum autotrophicum]ACN15758.1 putative metalloendopeptidase; cell wall-binding protein associated metalloendopeptidase [Desulforapulum autotrophicum HRM2]
MKKKIKIWLHTDSTSNIREFTVSKPQLIGLLFIPFLVVTVLVYFGYDYAKLKNASFENDLLCRQIENQDSEISLQRSQLQALASEINKIKDNVSALSNFENKVRIVANIKKKDDVNGGFFGIGGVSGEDIDPDIPLYERHNSLMREMHQQTDQINLSAQQQKVNFEELLTILNKKRNLLAATPSIRPAKGWITSPFGYRSSPFTGKKEFHSGLDIANKKGKKIVATANGVVAYAGEKRLIGKMVMIDHGHGIVTKFGHMDKIFVKKGAEVNRGEVIGLMGNTGRSTGSHVHYEVRINGTPVNPEKYIVN